MAPAHGHGTLATGSCELLLELARSRRILFFGGKGGVGKTTVSAATALALASEGRRALLVSTDPAHNLGHLFNREIGPRPVRLAPGLDGLELDPDATVREHADEVSGALRSLMPVRMHAEVDKHIALSKEAPGMQEAAILEKMAELVERGREEYEHVIFDTAPSGHTARLMALPEMMTAWTEGLIRRRERADRFAEFVRGLGSDSDMAEDIVGEKNPAAAQESRIRRILNRRRLKFAQLREALTNPELTSFVIVLVAERLPVLETIELRDRLRKAGLAIDCLAINKRLPAGAGEFLEERRAQQQIHLQTLAEALPDIPREQLDLVAKDIVGPAALKEFSHGLRSRAAGRRAGHDSGKTEPAVDIQTGAGDEA